MQQNTEIYFVAIIGIALALLLVGFIVGILLLYQRRRQRQEQEMERVKVMYEKETLRSQLEIQENTLKTLSQELHDNIGQMLSVVKLSLSVLPIEREHIAYEASKDAQQLLNKAIYDLSNLTKGLHTDRIAQVGLAECIRFELDAIKKTGIVNVRFHLSGTEIPFGEQKAVFLFRMFQELLHNSLKHSQATELMIDLIYMDDSFSLEMADNGVGFDLKEKQKADSSSGVGLKSIFNRAALIGATVSIDSTPNEGTNIFIHLPLEKE